MKGDEDTGRATEEQVIQSWMQRRVCTYQPGHHEDQKLGDSGELIPPWALQKNPILLAPLGQGCMGRCANLFYAIKFVVIHYSSPGNPNWAGG